MTRHTARLTALGFVGALFASLVVATVPVAAINGDSMYLSPASGSYAVGSIVAVAVRENSNGDQVNAAEADLTYPTSTLQFISFDSGQSAFGIEVAKSGGNGSASMARANITPLSGDKLITVANFKVLTTGSALIQIQGGSQVLSNDTNTDVVDKRTGSNLTLVASNGTTSVAPSPTPTTKPSSTTSSSSPSVSVKKSTSNTTAGATTGNGKVELTGTAVIEATPNTDKQIEKVEYYLNKKLVATVTSPPYKHSLDTTHVRNGSYTLTVKTYYADKTVDATDTAIVVNNPWNAQQIWLQIAYFWWVGAILLLVLADIIWMAIRKRRRNAALTGLAAGKPGDAFKVYGGDDAGSFMTPEQVVVTPGTDTQPAEGQSDTQSPVASAPAHPVDELSAAQTTPASQSVAPQPITPTPPVAPPSNSPTASVQQPERPIAPAPPTTVPSNGGPGPVVQPSVAPPTAPNNEQRPQV